MHFQCQEKLVDEQIKDSSLSNNFEAYTITCEAFENITNESSAENIPGDSSITGDIKGDTINPEVSEKVTNESIAQDIPPKPDMQLEVEQCDVVKNTEDCTVRRSKRAKKRKFLCDYCGYICLHVQVSIRNTCKGCSFEN